MRFAIRTLLAWCLLSVSLFTGLAQAQQDDLYSIRVAVENQSPAARYEALQEGLRRVLVKVTGHSRIAPELLPPANRELEDLVSEYLYQPPLEPEFHETGVDLVARFVPGSVDRIVRNLGLPVWPASRPRVLVWLVANSEDGPRYLSAAQIPEIERALLGTFEQRAVTMRQPLLDLEDQFALPAEEAWSLEPERLQEASQRYSAPTVLLLRLEPPPHALELLTRIDIRGAELATDEVLAEPLPGELGDAAPWWVDGADEADNGEEAAGLASGQWIVEWLMLSDGQAYQEATVPDELAAVIAAGVNNAIDVLARTQAYVPSENSGEIGIRMEVSDLLTLDDFKRAETLMRGLEMVRDLRLVALDGDRAQFELVLTGGGEVFLQSLRNSGHFSAVEDQGAHDRDRFASEPVQGAPVHHAGDSPGWDDREDHKSDDGLRPQERESDGRSLQRYEYDGIPTQAGPEIRSFHFSWVP